MPSEYVARWAGGRIGLGASVFHFAGTNSPTAAQAAANAIRTFFNSIANTIGTGITITFDQEVRVLDANGTLTAVLPVTGVAPVSGSGGLDWTNGSGYMIRWNTSAINNGRRLLGRTFIVPAESGVFSSGNVLNASATSVTTAATTLLTSLSSASVPLQVWSRSGAVVAEVISATVPLRPTTLRTRNDRD